MAIITNQLKLGPFWIMLVMFLTTKTFEIRAFSMIRKVMMIWHYMWYELLTLELGFFNSYWFFFHFLSDLVKIMVEANLNDNTIFELTKSIDLQSPNDSFMHHNTHYLGHIIDQSFKETIRHILTRSIIRS